MRTAQRLEAFGTTVFAEMTALAVAHGAVNLAQGFPDYDGPTEAIEAAAEAARSGRNQYARSIGTPELVGAIAADWNAALPNAHAARIDEPDRAVTVTCGCTEAIAATMLGLLNPGDEIVLFEPYYDSYAACVAMAGAVARHVTLRPTGPGSRFSFDEAELSRAITARTRAILVNTPHNPTGSVLGVSELEAIARACVTHGLVAISDEVYEHLVLDGAARHVRLATLDGMAERTITLNSIGKTFALTGWKIGWAIAPPALTRSVRAAHQFLTFAVATPLQLGAAAALTRCAGFLEPQRAMLARNCGALSAALARAGLVPQASQGTYFVMADHTRVSSRLGLGDDVAFCRYLTERVGVAAIPPTAFYANKEHGRRFARFAFCKREATIAEAIARLERGLGVVE
jgi:N-succinyldiaminopimelate aminotransferase